MSIEEQEFIISDIVNKKVANTMHNIIRPSSIEGKVRETKVYSGADYVQQKLEQGRPIDTDRVKGKSKQNENKPPQKCVKIAKSTENRLFENKSSSCKNLTSLQDIPSDNGSIDEINLGESIKQITTEQQVGSKKKSNIAQSKTIKSFRDIPNSSKIKSQKNIIKSSKSIKFSDKKDVFSYKAQNKNDRVKRKLKSYRRCETTNEDDEQCCRLI